MTTINAIMAIGRSGQLGLNNKLPWHDLDDLAWFARMTKNQILIAGFHTKNSLPPLPGRTVLLDDRTLHPQSFADSLNLPQVWVIGGAKTYQRWAPYVDRWHIAKVDYDGHADTWFNPNWLIKQGV